MGRGHFLFRWKPVVTPFRSDEKTARVLSNRKAHWNDYLTWVGAISVMAVALISAGAWLFGSERLLRLRSGLPAISADTTLLFCLSAAGMAAVAARKRFLPSITGLFTLLFALLGFVIGPDRGILYTIHRFFPHWTETVLSLRDVSIMTMVRPVATIFLLSRICVDRYGTRA